LIQAINFKQHNQASKTRIDIDISFSKGNQIVSLKTICNWTLLCK